MKRITPIKWWPLGVPLPKGWVLGQEPRVLCRSNHFMVLIVPAQVIRITRKTG